MDFEVAPAVGIDAPPFSMFQDDLNIRESQFRHVDGAVVCQRSFLTNWALSKPRESSNVARASVAAKTPRIMNSIDYSGGFTSNAMLNRANSAAEKNCGTLAATLAF
jgi:hypothetical protein